MSRRAYVGRYAPSPTGPLHFGSLVAAVAGFLDARRHGGRWLLRIEDIDPPRIAPGADEDIRRTLEAYGFAWDGELIRQSDSTDRHLEALHRLEARGLVYACSCSRRQLRETARIGALGPVYPGTCRRRGVIGEHAMRVLVTDEPVTVADRLQPALTQRLERELGDFVVRRRDGLVAYQLAVVVDDAAEGVTDVVRGVDLRDSTPRQVYLQELLGLPRPRYAHVPVIVSPSGEKLSKQTGAPPVRRESAVATLTAALDALGQRPPRDLAAASLEAIWEWAQAHWDMDALRGVAEIAAPPLALQQNRLW